MSPPDNSKNTKEKILEVANILFAKNGFSGASIRDIANEANVNIAAINYHFKSKENLYWEVFEFNYFWMNREIHKMGEQNLSAPELAVEIFNFFTSSGSSIMNTFKVFLSETVARPDDMLSENSEKMFGPPGGDVFLSKIKNDLGDVVSEAGQYWAMKMSFSIIVHFGVIMQTSIMKEKCKNDVNLTPEALRNALYHSVKAHLNYLKENPQLF